MGNTEWIVFLMLFNRKCEDIFRVISFLMTFDKTQEPKIQTNPRGRFVL